MLTSQTTADLVKLSLFLQKTQKNANFSKPVFEALGVYSMRTWQRILVNFLLTAFASALAYIIFIAVYNQGAGFGDFYLPFVEGFLLQVIMHTTFTFAVLAVIITPIFTVMISMAGNNQTTRLVICCFLIVIIVGTYSFFYNELWFGMLVPGVIGCITFYTVEYLTNGK